MDFRVVHPIPLTMNDVVREFHVLDAFGRRQRDSPEHQSGSGLAQADGEPRRNLEASLEGDGATDVLTVLVAERVLDVTTNCLQLSRERLDVRIGEMGVFGYFGDGHRGLPA